MGEAGYESRSSNCAFAGRRLTGRVRMTIAAGAVAYRERSFAHRGRWPDASGRATARAALVVVDVQEAFRPAVLDFERVAPQRAVLVQGAEAMGVPIVVTEQYPKGPGRDGARGGRAPA